MIKHPWNDWAPTVDDPHSESSSWGYKVWKKDGLYHRQGKPARTWGQHSFEFWRYGSLHNEEGPAVYTYDNIDLDVAEGHPDLEKLDIGYYLDGAKYTKEDWQTELNKRGLPYPVSFNSVDVCWVLNGSYHHDSKPARIEVFSDGTSYEHYYQRGILHNIHGPSQIIKDTNGNITDFYYFLNGHYKTKTEWLKETNKTCLKCLNILNLE